jgi:thiamine-monophosphate kinase
LIGQAEQGRVIRRSTARPGDAILVTGYPGRSVAGLQLLLADQASQKTDLQALVRAYNTPSHRAHEGRAIGVSGHATAMIDTSDGFLGDLGHICEESRVGATLFLENLPLSDDLRQAASKLERDPYDLVLEDSDDYELIITCARGNVERIRSAVAEISPVPVSDVGQVTDNVGRVQLIGPEGLERDITPGGWDHFKR